MSWGVCFSHSCQVLFAAGVYEGSSLQLVSLNISRHLSQSAWLVFLAAGVSLEVSNDLSFVVHMSYEFALSAWMYGVPNLFV